MGTRSMIGIENKDGSIECSYCHWDGYPSHNGNILSKHYRTEKKIRELLSHGDMSSLGSKINPPKGVEHSFETRASNVCTFYHRDRKEDLIRSKYVDSRRFVQNADRRGCEYAYLFSGGEWLVKPILPSGEEFKPVKEVLSATAE